MRGQDTQAFRNAWTFGPWMHSEYVIDWYAEKRVPRSKLAENWGVIIDKDQTLIRQSNAVMFLSTADLSYASAGRG